MNYIADISLAVRESFDCPEPQFASHPEFDRYMDVSKKHLSMCEKEGRISYGGLELWTGKLIPAELSASGKHEEIKSYRMYSLAQKKRVKDFLDEHVNLFSTAVIKEYGNFCVCFYGRGGGGTTRISAEDKKEGWRESKENQAISNLFHKGPEHGVETFCARRLFREHGDGKVETKWTLTMAFRSSEDEFGAMTSESLWLQEINSMICNYCSIRRCKNTLMIGAAAQRGSIKMARMGFRPLKSFGHFAIQENKKGLFV